MGPRNRLMYWTATAVPYKPAKSDLLDVARRVGAVFEAGGVLAIAGEGRIHVGEHELLELQDGPAYFALRSGVPIVPIAVNGGSWLDFRRTLRVRVGSPIPTGGRATERDRRGPDEGDLAGPEGARRRRPGAGCPGPVRALADRSVQRLARGFARGVRQRPRALWHTFARPRGSIHRAAARGGARPTPDRRSDRGSHRPVGRPDRVPEAPRPNRRTPRSMPGRRSCCATSRSGAGSSGWSRTSVGRRASASLNSNMCSLPVAARRRRPAGTLRAASSCRPSRSTRWFPGSVRAPRTRGHGSSTTSWPTSTSSSTSDRPARGTGTDGGHPSGARQQVVKAAARSASFIRSRRSSMALATVALALLAGGPIVGRASPRGGDDRDPVLDRRAQRPRRRPAGPRSDAAGSRSPTASCRWRRPAPSPSWPRPLGSRWRPPRDPDTPRCCRGRRLRLRLRRPAVADRVGLAAPRARAAARAGLRVAGRRRIGARTDSSRLVPIAMLAGGGLAIGNALADVEADGSAGAPSVADPPWTMGRVAAPRAGVGRRG